MNAREQIVSSLPQECVGAAYEALKSSGLIFQPAEATKRIGEILAAPEMARPAQPKRATCRNQAVCEEPGSLQQLGLLQGATGDHRLEKTDDGPPHRGLFRVSMFWPSTQETVNPSVHAQESFRELWLEPGMVAG